MKQRFKSVICVDLIVKKEKKILLMKRKNTGSDDGFYELPGGHLEKNEDLYEAMIREAKEELCIELKRNDIKIVHVLHHYNRERLNFIFETCDSKLSPEIGEKDKCSELKWVDIYKLPNNTTDKVKKIIRNYLDEKNYDKL